MCALPYPQQGYPKTLLHHLTKDDIIYWFRNSSGAVRIDTLCGVLECCLPFEVRYAGSLVEVLAKKDLTQLREMTFRANDFLKRNMSVDDNRLILFNSMYTKKEEPLATETTPAAVNAHIPPLTSTSCINLNSNASSSNNLQQSHLNSAKSSSSHQNLTSLSSSSAQERQSNRPNNPVRKPEPFHKTMPYEPPKMRQQTARNNSPSTIGGVPQPMANGTSTGSSSKSNCSSEDDNYMDEEPESKSPSGKEKDLLVLEHESTRQKLIIFLSLLYSTNHEAAAVYYSLISQVEGTAGDSSWLEGLDDDKLDEVILLYTLAIHHPAFSYEQRLMLSEILQKLRVQLIRNKCSKSYPSFFQPVQVYDQQYGHYYLQHLPNMPAQAHPLPPPIEHQVTPTPQHPPPTSVIAGPQSVLAAGLPQTSVEPPRIPHPQINYYQQHFPAYPVYLGAGTHHPQNPSYIQPGSPIVSTAGQMTTSTIGSNPPANIPPVLVKDAPVPGTSAIQSEQQPPPLTEMIPPVPNQFQFVRSETKYCYNCGRPGHQGADCTEKSLEIINSHLYRLKYDRGEPDDQL